MNVTDGCVTAGGTTLNFQHRAVVCSYTKLTRLLSSAIAFFTTHVPNSLGFFSTSCFPCIDNLSVPPPSQEKNTDIQKQMLVVEWIQIRSNAQSERGKMPQDRLLVSADWWIQVCWHITVPAGNGLAICENLCGIREWGSCRDTQQWSSAAGCCCSSFHSFSPKYQHLSCIYDKRTNAASLSITHTQILRYFQSIWYCFHL